MNFPDQSTRPLACQNLNINSYNQSTGLVARRDLSMNFCDQSTGQLARQGLSMNFSDQSTGPLARQDLSMNSYNQSTGPLARQDLSMNSYNQSTSPPPPIRLAGPMRSSSHCAPIALPARPTGIASHNMNHLRPTTSPIAQQTASQKKNARLARSAWRKTPE
ncbi:hypothetical protein MJO29_012062 [Puccinia striiformis f. sp. tritici]|nr:hypothetical protein MJO29_012062 [Puccinia striiformis f. sp. tritici]